MVSSPPAYLPDDFVPVQLNLSIPGFDFTPPSNRETPPPAQPANWELPEAQLTLSLDALNEPPA